MSANPSPLESALARLLGGIGNQTLKLDPASHPRLIDLAGTCVRFDVIPPSLTTAEAPEPRSITLRVRPDGLDLNAGNLDQPHVVVTGTLPEIARSFFSAEISQKVGPDRSSRLRIDGDEAVLQNVADLFKALQPDLAEPFSGLVGREVADGLVGLAEAGMAFLKSAAESVTAGARADATATWVDDAAFQNLMDRLDDLRLRADRLDARIQIFERKDEQGDGKP